MPEEGAGLHPSQRLRLQCRCRVVSDLPTGVQQPFILKFDLSNIPVCLVTLTGGGLDEKQLYDLAYNTVEPQLEQLPGVASANVDGGKIRQITVSLNRDLLQAKGIAVSKGLFPWTASGRAIANGRDEGFTKLLFDDTTHRIVGGGIVGTHAGDMIGEVALAIEMGADAVDIGKTIHPHPTLGESIGLAAEVAHGSCTDVPPPRKR